jgi:hypothetical protein
MFGTYASLKPYNDFELSLGYNGIITRYLDEFYSMTQNKMLETALPIVYQQAVNLNMRYKGINRWVLRTDHNVSFWTDKNYRIFGTAIGDRGIVSAATAEGFADVNHLLLWNGLGASYQLTSDWVIDAYVRNLRRIDTAIGIVDTGATENEEFRFIRNEIEAELRASWQPNPNLEFYTGIEVKNQYTIISKDIHSRMIGDRFPNGFVSPDAVRDTKDSTLKLRVPIGITVRMR